MVVVPSAYTFHSIHTRTIRVLAGLDHNKPPLGAITSPQWIIRKQGKTCRWMRGGQGSSRVASVEGKVGTSKIRVRLVLCRIIGLLYDVNYPGMLFDMYAIAPEMPTA